MSDNDFDVTALAAEHGIELGNEFDYSSNPYQDLDVEQEYDTGIGGYNVGSDQYKVTNPYETSNDGLPPQMLDPEIDYTAMFQLGIHENEVKAIKSQEQAKELEVQARLANHQLAIMQDEGFARYRESIEIGTNSAIPINPEVANFMQHYYGVDVDDLQDVVAYYRLSPKEIRDLEKSILGGKFKPSSEEAIQSYLNETRSNTTAVGNESEYETADNYTNDSSDMDLVVENFKHQAGLDEQQLSQAMGDAFAYLERNPQLNEELDTRDKVLQFLHNFTPKKPVTPTAPAVVQSQPKQTAVPRQANKVERSEKRSVTPINSGKSVPWSYITGLDEKTYAANVNRIEKLFQSGLIDYSK